MRHGIKNFDLARLHLGCLLGHSRGCQEGNAEPKQSQLCHFLHPSMGTDQALPAGKLTKDTGRVAKHFLLKLRSQFLP